MYFLITVMREKGIARPWKDIRHSGAIWADVNIRNELCQVLNRTSDVAAIFTDMPLDTPKLHPLLDARVSGMAANAFTLSGLEELDGCLYAQSWWCRPI